MAKYIITSIPQYRNGGIKKKKQSVVKSGFNSPVEGGIPQSALSGFMSNESMVNQPTQYTVDPNQQDIPYNQRTSLQQLATQPEFGNVGYGYKKDPFTGELKTVPAGTPTYEGDIFNRLVTNVKANPDAAVDYEGNKLKCAPGSRPWKGVCLTNEEYAQVQAEEEENVNYRDQEEQKARQKRIQEANENYINRYESYISDIDKGIKKGDKYKKDLLIPFETYTKKDIENNPKLKGDYDNKSSNLYNGYYIEKKDLGKDDYEINLYPKGAIKSMMSRLKPFEFETYHGLNAKQLQTEFGDYLKYIDQVHVEQGAKMIDKLTKQGYSAEDAKRQLVKNGYNDIIGVTQFKDIANAYDIKNNADTYFVDDNLVMYKKDKTGKVYKYTNSYGNDNFSVADSSKYKESDNPLKDTKNWIWESVDPSKVKTNKEGNITVNGRSANLYDYGFGDRPGDKNDKAILSKYTTAVGSMYKESEEASAVGSYQQMYDNLNNTLYDNVYTSNSGQKIEPINLVSTFESGISTEYVTAYNNLVNQLNKTTDVTKRGKLLDEFNTKTNKSIKVAKPDGKGFYDTKVNMGKFSAYDGQKDWGAPYIPSVNGGRDVKAYKTSSGLKNQINYAKNNEAQNILEYAYTNKINPGSENLNYVGYDGSKYTGEEEDTDLSFAQWSQTPEAQEFITNYNKDPKYAEKIFNVEKNRAEKKWQDYQNENSLWKKPTLSNFLEKTGQQISSLTNQPVYTLNQWASGKEIDPMIGLMPDAPTQSNINDWEAKLGPGGSRLFLDKHAALNKDLSTQIVNLFNFTHYANQAGHNLRNLYEGDPDQGVGDLALNAAFSLLPVSKSLQALSAAKLLPGAKYVGKLANNRLYNATRNLITPGAGLTGMFVKDAFLPTGEIDPNTGEEIQGFGIEAGKNIWNEIEKAKEKAKISNSLPPSSSPFSSLDYLAHLDSDKVKENLFGLGMAGMIGVHGGKQVLGFGKDLFRRAPNFLPANTRLLNNRYNFKMDPAQFNQQYYRSKLDPKEPLRLKKEGGDLPQAKMGWPPKGLKKITRSNYNPISYPIKKIGYKIAVQDSGHSRTKEQFLQGIKGTSEDTYWGQQGSDYKNTYGAGKRDLPKLYFFGDETGFEPIDYDFSSDKGLDSIIQEYGPLKAFLLNSLYRHEVPIDWHEFTGERLNKDLNKHEPFLDFTFPTVDFNKNVAELPIHLHSYNYLSNALANPENALITEKTKELARDRFNKLFDQYGSDTVPVDINGYSVSGPIGKRPFLDLYNENPVRPKDNLGGHMGFLKRLPNGEFEWVTRDLWSFRPEAYNTKWDMRDGFKQAQTQLMDMFGKPFVLTQTNPVKFKEGGDLPKAKMGWPPKGLRSRRSTSTVFGKPTYKPSSTYFNKGITTGNIFSSTKKLPTNNVNIKYPIQFGDEPYKLSGEPMYYVNPLDYEGLDWKKEGIKDYLYTETREPTTRLVPELEKNLNNIEGSDISIDLNKLGDFDFKPWSDGWEVRNQMMNAFDGPQKTLSKSDFWTDADLNKSINLGKQFDEHHDEFMDFLSVDDVPGFIQKYPHLAEIFTDEFKFPKGKFYSNQAQRKLINNTNGFGYAMIDPLGTGALNALAKGKPFPKTVSEYFSSKASVLGKPDIKFDSTLPSAQTFNAFAKDKDWLRRQDPFTYYKSLQGLPWADEIINKAGNIHGLSRTEAQAMQDALIEKRYQMLRENVMKDINKNKPFKGRDAWNQITSQPGWKNKNGGISMQLNKKEINKYVQGGYIVEEE